MGIRTRSRLHNSFLSSAGLCSRTTAGTSEFLTELSLFSVNFKSSCGTCLRISAISLFKFAARPMRTATAGVWGSVGGGDLGSGLPYDPDANCENDEVTENQKPRQVTGYRRSRKSQLLETYDVMWVSSVLIIHHSQSLPTRVDLHITNLPRESYLLPPVCSLIIYQWCYCTPPGACIGSACLAVILPSWIGILRPKSEE